MRAVVVQHEEQEDEGWFGPALVDAGFALVRRFRTVVASDADADLVVVLGGTMAAFETARHPFLGAELDLLRARLGRGAPCLGICLGAQLLAGAAGAPVFRGATGPEIGALPIRWTDASREDPVVDAGDAMVVAHWHQDTFAPVPGAVRLASTDRYPQQAFRLASSYAFQFHLELDSAAAAAWFEAGRAEWTAAGHDVAAMQAGLPAMRTGDRARQSLVGRLAAHFAAVARARRR